ncbi:Peptidase_C39 like family protein [Micromonospora pallida]|uniref:Peptidase_C39 like family protein n=1 Tax=Micromonospora pallida TaxID=145854 RepID=A0A1C6SRL4_9ACTN|nr:C39 family peptidase [Micromonospora pallida]SCL32221.1 Peptidase_C39 like family protein [Micromonospora pallida]
MKYPVNRPFNPFRARRSYQVAAAAAVLVAASTAGALLTNPDTPVRQGDTVAAAAEANRSAAASRDLERTAASPASPSAVATTAPATPSASPTATATADPDVTAKPTPPKPPASKVLDIQYQAQTTYYYCGPAATRIALTARDIVRTQDDLAQRLNTTEAGTNSAEDTTRVLNALVGKDFYRTRMISGGSATPAQMDRLQADVVRAVGSGYAVVVNIAGSATDVDGGWHSYPGGHYLTVVGYRDNGRTVKISDPANPAASSYWMTTIDLANWAATRGYSA